MRVWLLILFLFILLLIRFGLYYHKTSNYTSGQQLSVQTTLFTEPQTTGNFQKFSVRDEGGELIFITIPRYPQFHYGDIVRVIGKIQKRVINSKKIITTMQFPRVEAIEKEKNIVLAITYFIRQKVISIFEKTLPPTSSSLLLGIVFGIKQNMGKEFADAVRISGVFHVIAASGMNVTLVGGFLSSFFMLFFRRQIALVASILGISFYAFLAGLEPSIIRASIMGIAVFSSQILGRQSLAVYTLALAGFIMLFISPPILEDIGFQLSFLSTLGILYIKSILNKPFATSRILSKFFIESDITTTISAQLATLPILLSNSGQYSLLSILANGLVLWTIPTIMILGGIGAIVGIVFEPLGRLLVYLCLPFLLYFEKVVSFFGNNRPIAIEEFPLSFTIGYYCILISLVILVNRKR